MVSLSSLFLIGLGALASGSTASSSRALVKLALFTASLWQEGRCPAVGKLGDET